MSFARKRLAPALLIAAVLLQGCAKAPTIEAHFSPSGSPTAAIIEAIGAAKKSIHVQAYSFTSAPIADALKQAHGRGVNVQVILDRSQQTGRYSVMAFLRNAGIGVWIDHSHAIAHNKVIIIDGAVVVTGSFNFTRAAEDKNAENILIVRDAAIARAYLENWQRCKAHSEK